MIVFIVLKRLGAFFMDLALNKYVLLLLFLFFIAFCTCYIANTTRAGLEECVESFIDSRFFPSDSSQKIYAVALRCTDASGGR